MGKHLTTQRYVLKVHSAELIKHNRNFNITLDQARKEDKLIGISESQIIRVIDRMNGIEDSEALIRESKHIINENNALINNATQNGEPILEYLKAIRYATDNLNRARYKQDYMCVVMDSPKDYAELYHNGFTVNGIQFRRLLGTTGGIKMSTIVFVNKDKWEALNKFINNGRNPEKEFTPAKLEAYKALVCSSSTPVSSPKHPICVPDCNTKFITEAIELNDEEDGEPRITYQKEREITLCENDGYGIAMPELMAQWGEDMQCGYLIPGCVIRNAFCKGAIYPVDFRKFAHEHGFTQIMDSWGDIHNIDDVDLILTESMLKLWDSYYSMKDYLDNCAENGYQFCITKVSEYELENVRNMNYQFLQSYDFTDEDIEELITPTLEEINDILGNDYRKSILYTKGTGLNRNSFNYLDPTFSSALMIDRRMRDDPYVQSQIVSMIKKRIQDAKVGVLKVQGCYALVSGDPYSLCQSMFGMEVTGLLKAGEIYSKYWIDRGVNEIVAYRAPMTSHNNIRKLKVVHNPEMDDFYQYMRTPMIFNSWDSCADAMNGMDKDGDAVITTSADVLLRNTVNLPVIECIQRKAKKKIVTEDDLFQSNVISFGNEVGKVTNRVTSMFEVQSWFKRDSQEYKDLAYRIMCGQLYQQNKQLLAKCSRS